MTRAMLLAVGAAVLAAAGLIELATASLRVRARPAGRPDTQHTGPDAQHGLAAGRHGPAPRHGLSAARRRLTVALARLGSRLGVPAAPEDLARRLDAAGASPGMTVAEVMALKCAAALVAGLAALPAAAILPGRLGPVGILAAPAGGFLVPDALLTRRTRRRRATIAAELADVLDLLHVAVAAGLPPLRALGEVGRRRAGLLPAELRTAATRAELGIPRSQALESLVQRCPSDGVTALVAAIRRTERHGAPLGRALQALAADARAQQAQRIRERAARAAPKIQLVVALLLVPSVMLLVGASLAAAML
jgi:tight adherence protein C